MQSRNVNGWTTPTKSWNILELKETFPAFIQRHLHQVSALLIPASSKEIANSKDIESEGETCFFTFLSLYFTSCTLNVNCAAWLGSGWAFAAKGHANSQSLTLQLLSLSNPVGLTTHLSHELGIVPQPTFCSNDLYIAQCVNIVNTSTKTRYSKEHTCDLHLINKLFQYKTIEYNPWNENLLEQTWRTKLNEYEVLSILSSAKMLSPAWWRHPCRCLLEDASRRGQNRSEKETFKKKNAKTLKIFVVLVVPCWI